MYLSICLSLYFPTCLSVYLSLFHPIYLCLHLRLHLHLHLYFYLHLYLYLYMHVYVYMVVHCVFPTFPLPFSPGAPPAFHNGGPAGGEGGMTTRRTIWGKSLKPPNLQTGEPNSARAAGAQPYIYIHVYITHHKPNHETDLLVGQSVELSLRASRVRRVRSVTPGHLETWSPAASGPALCFEMGLPALVLDMLRIKPKHIRMDRH